MLSNSLALGHPSAPATGTSLNAPNLGASMRIAGKSFAGYSENLSSASDPLAYSAGGTFTLPASTNQDFSSFKSIAGIAPGLTVSDPVTEYALCGFIAANEGVAAPAACGSAAALALFAAGLVGVGLVRRRRG